MANFEAITLKHLVTGGMDIIPELHTDLFTDRYKKLYTLCLEYFDSHKHLPNLVELRAVVEAKAPSSVRPQFIATVESLEKLDTTGVDISTTITQLRDLKVLRDVDEQITSLVEAQRDKDTTKVKQLLNKLSEKVNLRGVKVTDLADAQHDTDDHAIVSSYLGKEYDHLTSGHSGLVVYGAKSGGGKALHNDTLIPTVHGKVRIADLVVGDTIYGRNGCTTTVQGVFPQGVRPTYKVTLIDGRSILADAEHIWTVINGDGKESDKTTTELINEGVCKMRYDKRYNSYQHNHRYYLPLCSPVQYRPKEYVIPPYVLGAILGDGSTAHNVINYTAGDVDIIKFITQDVGTDAVITDRSHKYNYGITGCPTYLKYLRDNNLMVKSNAKYIPQEYLQGSVQQRELLLQGLLDTDGTVSNKASTIEFSTVAKGLADGVAELVRSLGGACTTSLKHNAGYKNKDGVFVQCQLVYRLNIRFYTTNEVRPFRLPRKANKYTNSNKRKSIAITSIEYVGEEECTCIKVDALDHLFIAGDYIVTHNTIALLQTAVNNYLDGKNVLFISLELSRKVLYNRLLAMQTGIDFTRINSKILTPEETVLCTKAHNTFFNPNNKNWFKVVDDQMTDNELTNLIAVKSQLDDVHVVCIDYLNLISFDASLDDWRGLSNLAKNLHRLTKTYPVCIVTAAQVNIEGKTKGSIMPNVTTRGSKELEFSASQLFYFDVEPESNMLVCYTKKNRIAKPVHFLLEPDFAHMKINPTDIVLGD